MWHGAWGNFGLRIADFGLRIWASIGHRAWDMEKYSWQEAAGSRQNQEDRSQRSEVRSQRSDIRGLRSGINLISDLRLLTSVIDDFYDSNGYGFDDLTS